MSYTPNNIIVILYVFLFFSCKVDNAFLLRVKRYVRVKSLFINSVLITTP